MTLPPADALSPVPPLKRLLAAVAVVLFLHSPGAVAADLEEILQKGVLRHLGVPYACFVTGSGDGLDVEMVKGFARHLGVRYEFVETTWAAAIDALTGKIVTPSGDSVDIRGRTPIRGDIIAGGLTILAWREKAVDFSPPLFPTQIWLVTRQDSPMNPIVPGLTVGEDIARVKTLLKGREVMGKAGTCLDPRLYGLAKAGARPVYTRGKIIELPAAVINGEAQTALMEVPDVLMAFEKWPGKLKVIGPVSLPQQMGYAFRKTSPRLREAFDAFFERCLAKGIYLDLVKKYCPAVLFHYPDFPARLSPTP